jgi:flagellar hook-basal body complex protein FliE
MPINPISGINPLAIVPGPEATGNSTLKNSPIASFEQMLSTSIDSLKQQDASSTAAITSLASGQDVDVHQALLSMQQTEIAFNLALQVRNKMVDAYQEIMRMQI